MVMPNLIVVASSNLKRNLILPSLSMIFRTVFVRKVCPSSIVRRNVLPTNSSGVNSGNFRSDGSVCKPAISSMDWKIGLSCWISPIHNESTVTYIRVTSCSSTLHLNRYEPNPFVVGSSDYPGDSRCVFFENPISCGMFRP
jgi:hypothetical protein